MFQGFSEVVALGSSPAATMEILAKCMGPNDLSLGPMRLGVEGVDESRTQVVVAVLVRRSTGKAIPSPLLLRGSMYGSCDPEPEAHFGSVCGLS